MFYDDDEEDIYESDNNESHDEEIEEQNSIPTVQSSEQAEDMVKRKVGEVEKKVSNKVKNTTKEASKKVGKQVLSKILAVLAPFLPYILATVLAIGMVIAFWGAIQGIVGEIKNAITGAIDSIVSFFTLDGTTYKISEDQIDNMMKNLKEANVDLDNLDLTRSDIETFLEANLITQTVDGYSVGDKKGAIQIWMTNPSDETEGLTGSKKLTFVSYDSFQREVSKGDSSCLSHYTVDSSNNIIVASQNRHTVVEDGRVVTDEITYATKSFGYKTATAQFNMPIMFFIDMCSITSNKNYVLELATQVKDTQIIMTVQDCKTDTYTVSSRIEKYTIVEEDGTETEVEEIITVETTDISHNLIPTVTKADTLLYTKEMIYTNKVETTSSGSSRITTNTYNPGIEKDLYVKYEEFGKTAKTRYLRGEPYPSLIDGGDMLFKLMEENVNNESIEQTLKYILYKLSKHDFGVTELDGITINLGNLREIGTATVGGLTQFIRYLHAWESNTGVSSDGTMYLIGTDGYGNPTVGYGVDIFNGGFEGRFLEAGYSTKVGDYVPVEFVDALEEEEIRRNIEYVQSKTAGLNLTQYQIYALVSRAYNCGTGGAFAVRNGKDFIEAYKSYWNEEIDNEYKVAQNNGMYEHNLYKLYMAKPNTAKTPNGSVYSKGLENRRKSEWILFKTGYYDRINEYCQTTASGSAGRILEVAEEIHSYMEQNNYSYCILGAERNSHSGGHGLNNTFEESKTGYKLTCCATYVSWVLRDAGLIDTTIHGALQLGEYLVKNGFTIVSYSEMEAGDIVIMTRSGGGHTQIYAGDGQWYNAGSESSVTGSAPYTSQIDTSRIKYVLRAPN